MLGVGDPLQAAVRWGHCSVLLWPLPRLLTADMSTVQQLEHYVKIKTCLHIHIHTTQHTCRESCPKENKIIKLLRVVRNVTIQFYHYVDKSRVQARATAEHGLINLRVGLSGI